MSENGLARSTSKSSTSSRAALGKRGYVENFHTGLRDEFLALEQLESLAMRNAKSFETLSSKIAREYR